MIGPVTAVITSPNHWNIGATPSPIARISPSAALSSFLNDPPSPASISAAVFAAIPPAALISSYNILVSAAALPIAIAPVIPRRPNASLNFAILSPLGMLFVACATSPSTSTSGRALRSASKKSTPNILFIFAASAAESVVSLFSAVPADDP